ncbi:hypothetical protein JCM14469_01420 [Desulfatiferula olefinivorans]
MGRITASVSHELQNVLAIIRETAGLMQDFLMMGDRCTDLEERLDTSLKRIKDQVNRGVGLTHNLNRFAHGPDFLTSVIDTRDALERLLALTERIFRNKGYSVTLSPGDPVALEQDPMAFQLLAFLCLETLTGVLPSGQTLTVSVKRTGPSTVITCCCPSPAAQPVSELTASVLWPDLTEACRQSGVVLGVTESCPGVTLTFD